MSRWEVIGRDFGIQASRERTTSISIPWAGREPLPRTVSTRFRTVRPCLPNREARQPPWTEGKELPSSDHMNAPVEQKDLRDSKERAPLIVKLRRLEGVVGKPVGVRVPPSAPWRNQRGFQSEPESLYPSEKTAFGSFVEIRIERGSVRPPSCRFLTKN
jgi:hypothetical protein